LRYPDRLPRLCAETAYLIKIIRQGIAEREFFIDNLLVRIHFFIVMIRWTGLAPWEFEFPFPGSLASTFLGGIVMFSQGSELLRYPDRIPCLRARGQLSVLNITN